MTDQRFRVQALLGSALVAVGTVGFFYNGDFTSNSAVRDDVLGLISVNGWENALYVVTGALTLAVPTRAWLVALGAFFLALAIWGFVLGNGESILSILPVNTAGNVLHLGIGVAALVAAR